MVCQGASAVPGSSSLPLVTTWRVQASCVGPASRVVAGVCTVAAGGGAFWGGCGTGDCGRARCRYGRLFLAASTGDGSHHKQDRNHKSSKSAHWCTFLGTLGRLAKVTVLEAAAEAAVE